MRYLFAFLLLCLSPVHAGTHYFEWSFGGVPSTFRLDITQTSCSGTAEYPFSAICSFSSWYEGQWEGGHVCAVAVSCTGQMQVTNIQGGGPVFRESALNEFLPSYVTDCPQCSACDPVDTGSVGLNCCPSPQFGATYYVATGGDGCDYIACNTANCQDCPPPPSGTEGEPCSCGEGMGNGVKVLVYNNDGCPVGFTCDECEPCPELTGEGSACTVRVNGEDVSGTLVKETGPDGCPYLTCQPDDDECQGGCCEDFNEDGVPDVLEGNELRNNVNGDECECGEESGTVKWENNGFGCLVPVCKCDCEGRGGDSDGDGCCDDEDPDPNDADSDCESCNYEIGWKIGVIAAIFQSKINLPTGGTATSAVNFDIDLGSQPIPVMGQVVAFGQRFGGNLSSGEFWIGEPVAPRTDGVNHEVFTWFADRRDEFRGLLSLVCYFLFSRTMLLAIFNPAR